MLQVPHEILRRLITNDAPKRTYVGGQSGPTSCHIWRQTAFGRFYGDSFNKKLDLDCRKQQSQTAAQRAGRFFF